MIRTILIGLDGSPYSDAAVDLGVAWASRFDAMVVGLGIIDKPGICGPAAVPVGGGAYKEEVEEARLKDAERKIDLFLEKFELRCSEAQVAHKQLQEEGTPEEQIVLQSQRYDVILLGQQSYFAFETQEGPSHTLENVLQYSPRPVVAVPKDTPGGSTVMVAYDGSLQSARALQAVSASGVATDREVHIVSVNPDKVEAARVADRAVEFLGFHNIKAHPHPLAASDNCGALLLEKAQEFDAELMAMGCYGKNSFTSFFFGSVTKHVLQHTTRPLFLYH